MGVVGVVGVGEFVGTVGGVFPPGDAPPVAALLGAVVVVTVRIDVDVVGNEPLVALRRVEMVKLTTVESVREPTRVTTDRFHRPHIIVMRGVRLRSTFYFTQDSIARLHARE